MNELGQSLPGSESFVEAEHGAERKQPNEFCLNCGTKLQDTFCHHCGQKDIPKRQTLGELWTNFISSFWSYEGKFFLTTRYLITKPGFLAIEYNKGKRESYYHPARMYVFISFIFFLLLSIAPNFDSDKVAQVNFDNDDVKELKEENPTVNVDSILQNIPALTADSAKRMVPRAALDSIGKVTAKKTKKKKGFSINKKNYESRAKYDSIQQTLAAEKKDGWFKRKLIIRGLELTERYRDKEDDLGKEFGKAFLDNFSKVLFFLLPVFALLLKLLYIRKDYFYSEHLVFSIYYYNFFYLAGSLQILSNFVENISVLSWIGNVVGIWIIVYLLLAMKRMYGQSWRKTILKFFIFGFLFLICLVVGFSISAIFLLFVI